MNDIKKVMPYVMRALSEPDGQCLPIRNHFAPCEVCPMIDDCVKHVIDPMARVDDKKRMLRKYVVKYGSDRDKAKLFEILL